MGLTKTNNDIMTTENGEKPIELLSFQRNKKKIWDTWAPFLIFFASNAWLFLIPLILKWLTSLIFQIVNLTTYSWDEYTIRSMKISIFETTLELIISSLIIFLWMKPSLSLKAQRQDWSTLCGINNGKSARMPVMLICAILLYFFSYDFLILIFIFVIFSIYLLNPALENWQVSNSRLEGSYDRMGKIFRLSTQYLLYAYIIAVIWEYLRSFIQWGFDEFDFLFYFGITKTIVLIVFGLFIFRKYCDSPSISGKSNSSSLLIWGIIIGYISSSILGFFLLALSRIYSQQEKRMILNQKEDTSNKVSSTISNPEIASIDEKKDLIVFIQAFGTLIWGVILFQSISSVSNVISEIDSYLIFSNYELIPNPNMYGILLATITSLIGFIFGILWLRPALTRKVLAQDYAKIKTKPMIFGGMILIAIGLGLSGQLLIILCVAIREISQDNSTNSQMITSDSVERSEITLQRILPYVSLFAIVGTWLLLLSTINYIIQSIYWTIRLWYTYSTPWNSLWMYDFIYYIILFGLILYFGYFKPKFMRKILSGDYSGIRKSYKIIGSLIVPAALFWTLFLYVLTLGYGPLLIAMAVILIYYYMNEPNTNVKD